MQNKEQKLRSDNSRSPVDRLDCLLDGLLAGRLSAAEAREVGRVMSEDPEARERFAEFCEIHALLETDEAVSAELAEWIEPENVVTLPGAKPVAHASATMAAESEMAGVSGNGAGRKTGGGSWRLGLGMAACFALFFGALALYESGRLTKLAGGAPEDDPGAEPAVVAAVGDDVEQPEAEVRAEPEAPSVAAASALSPEEEYSRMIKVGNRQGSLNRPPTNFVSAGGDGKVQFNRDIRPILSDNCFFCHGPDSAARKADLRLDKEEAVFEPRGDEPPVIVPGNPQESPLFQRITHEDPEEVMPPLESHKSITPQQIAKLKRWIEEGAPWEEHWAFIAPVKPELPPASREWPRNEIDHFVLYRLDREGIELSPEADRYTLIRRLSLDLTGLPPTPSEIRAFVNDESADAYEALVDRLLSSRNYGEHRARYWLDAARYADTHGLHLDNFRGIWPYRDWVIEAYNRNMPFDEFTIEQLAGDLLEGATQSQLVATGFNRCNVTTSEGGAIAEEFLARYAVDRVETTATVWMGLTAGCASCHDHKFDPLTMREFYRLFAYFNNTTQPAMDGNAPDTPPVIRVYASEELKHRQDEVVAALGKLDEEAAQAGKAAEPAFAEWLAGDAGKATWNLGRRESSLYRSKPDQKPGEDNEAPMLTIARPFTISFRVKAPEKVEGDMVVFSKTDPANHHRGYRVVLNDMEGIGLELIEKWPEKALKMSTIRRIKPGGSYYLTFTYDGSGTAEGVQIYLDGKPLAERFPHVRMNTLEEDFVSEAPMQYAPLPEQPEKLMVSDLRIFARNLTNAEILAIHDEPEIPKLLAKAPDKRTKIEQDQIHTHYLQTLVDPYKEVLARKSVQLAELAAIHRSAPTTLVMGEKPEPARAHILERGEYDKPKDEVSPGVPEFLPPLEEGTPENRMGLARWLVDPGHPLTARVTVNRMWQELFGTGLVKTSEDFGTQGEPPSHPELLDWLAVAFVESGWDVKALYKEMVMSATYRQSSKVRRDVAAIDAENRLLARGPRHRLDAEMLRDQSLFVSGILANRIGGPSVKPYQPSGIWQAVGYTNSNTQTFFQDYGADELRRSLYIFWKRTAPPPNMAIFDAPDRESCTVRRERTNTPLQALVLMNDPQFVRNSRHLAQRAIENADTVDERVQFLAMTVLGRPMEDAEAGIVKRSLSQFEEVYSADAEAAAKLVDDSITPQTETAENPGELAAWTLVASQFLNLDEAITKH